MNNEQSFQERVFRKTEQKKFYKIVKKVLTNEIKYVIM